MPFGTYRYRVRPTIVRGMKIRAVLIAAALVLGVAAPARAADGDPPPVPATPGAWITGVGHFTFTEPGVDGHRIRFSVLAGVDRKGRTHGVFGYRHLLPDGQLVAEGFAEVTCVSVRGRTALLTAVVPEGKGPIRNHAFYLRLVDGRPDLIDSVQAANGTARPVPYCVDTVPFRQPQYPIELGGYAFGS